MQNRNIEALKNALMEYSGKRIVVGSHGTALSTVINYFNKSFVYEDFLRIKMLMPWIVRFLFDGEICIEIEEYDLFAN